MSMYRRNSDEEMNAARRRVQLDPSPSNVFALARAYERLGLDSRRAITVVTVGRTVLVFAHDVAIRPSEVKRRLRDAIRARFSLPEHQAWLRDVHRAGATWALGASLPSDAYASFGLDLISRDAAGLVLVEDDVVLPVPPGSQDSISAEVSVGQAGAFRFNAVAWFRSADPSEILRLARDQWGGSGEHDTAIELLDFCAERDPSLRAFLEDNDEEPHVDVDEDEARAWLSRNKPRVWRALPVEDDGRGDDDSDLVDPDLES